MATNAAMALAKAAKTPPRELAPGLSVDVETIITTALAKDRDDRYATALDLAEDELRRGVESAYRINAVLQLLTLTVFEGQGEATGAEMADLWLPRVAAGLTHDW